MFLNNFAPGSLTILKEVFCCVKRFEFKNAMLIFKFKFLRSFFLTSNIPSSNSIKYKFRDSIKLKEDGYIIFPKLENSLIETLIKQYKITCKKCYRKEYDDLLNEIYEDNKVRGAFCNLKSSKEINLLINNVLPIVQDTLRLKRDEIRIYTGCDTLISPKCESIYNKSVTPFSDDALKFHRDFDGLRFLKYFILLTDTNAEKAPHYLIKNSASKGYINFWGDKRFNKNQILKHFKDSSIKKFEGPKGLNFLEDTSNYHSGSIPKDGTRILITILFIDSNSAQYKSTSIARKYFEESLRSINKILISEPYICFNLLDDGLYNHYGEKISIFNNSIK